MGSKESGELTLKVPWGHIAAKTWGDSRNTPVLVVHGIMDNAGSFDRLIKLLPDNFYYVCIDLPGHGLSSHFPAGLTLSYISYVLSLRYVLDELKWESVYYMGHSFGAHIGFLFAVLYPERIKKLILFDSLVAEMTENHELLNRIRQEYESAMETTKSNKPRTYTEDEILYALRTMRMCALNSDAARSLFDRAVTKVDENSFCYNRDIRTKLRISPLFNPDQTLYILSQIKVQTLFFRVSDTVKFVFHLRPHYRNELPKYDKIVKVVDVEGNHDVHNNHPERVSNYVSEFLNVIPSKL